MVILSVNRSISEARPRPRRCSAPPTAATPRSRYRGAAAPLQTLTFGESPLPALSHVRPGGAGKPSRQRHPPSGMCSHSLGPPIIRRGPRGGAPIPPSAARATKPEQYTCRELMMPPPPDANALPACSFKFSRSQLPVRAETQRLRLRRLHRCHQYRYRLALVPRQSAARYHSNRSRVGQRRRPFGGRGGGGGVCAPGRIPDSPPAEADDCPPPTPAGGRSGGKQGVTVGRPGC